MYYNDPIRTDYFARERYDTMRGVDVFGERIFRKEPKLNLTIDPELLHYIPSANEETDAELKASIKALGRPLKPLLVWDGQNVLIDGHRRYKAAQELGIAITPDMCQFMEFEDKASVKKFMDTLYLTTRHLSDIQRAIVTARHMSTVAPKQKGEAREKLAAQRGVSAKTVQRDERVGMALDTLPNAFRERVKTGELPATKDQIVELASLPPDEQEELVAAVDRGEFESIGDALRGQQVEEKPDAEALKKDAIRLLGKLMAGVCRLNEASPKRKALAECRRLTDEIGEQIGAW